MPRLLLCTGMFVTAASSTKSYSASAGRGDESLLDKLVFGGTKSNHACAKPKAWHTPAWLSSVILGLGFLLFRVHPARWAGLTWCRPFGSGKRKPSRSPCSEPLQSATNRTQQSPMPTGRPCCQHGVVRGGCV